MSQLELALRPGTTQRHVSFIERGRSLPGRGMVVRLDDPSLDPVRSALEHVLNGHMPYPAVLTDRDAQLVATNPRRARCWRGQRRGCWTPVNLARVLLHPDGVAPLIGNLTEGGWHVIDGLVRKADRDANHALEALITELVQYVPPRPRHVPPGHLGFAVPLRLRAGEQELALLTTLAHFATAVDVAVAELTLEAFLPADAATAAFSAPSSRARTNPRARDTAAFEATTASLR